MPKIEEVIGKAVTKIAFDVEADCIISTEQKQKEEYEEDFSHMDVTVTIFRKIRKGVYTKRVYDTEIRKVESGSMVPIKELLMEAIIKKYIGKGDRVVCVEDESMGTGYKGLLFVFDVDKIFFDISTHNLAENIRADVIEAVINIALEIGREGREGKKFGTGFIIGDKTDILKYTKQMIFNPFAGQSEELRKITEPEIKETVKEFSQLDGVFVIDKEGMIITAGSYVNVDLNGVDVNLPGGFGTRHRCCAALTNVIDVIAIVVSESGGLVRVFKNGKVIMKLS
ncbi:hypothetical protein CL621_01965 [archaeon]|nr:hypothetical protein [archaeon]